MRATPGIERISISWNASSDADLLGYNVYRSARSDGGYVQLPSDQGSAFTTGLTAYVDSSLAGGDLFFYKVSIVTDDGETPVFMASGSQSPERIVSGLRRFLVARQTARRAGVTRR